ncbi:MAG: polysaccharide deacetylase family protein, partial [Eubacteriales bacterium]|nr:polysaccharide deacetylase family protein [Eubacteriales bacterium]
TWDEMADAAKDGVIYFGNHSFGMHKFKPRYGIAQKPYESDDEYVKIFTADTMKLHDKIKEYAGYDTAVYAYPFGKYSALAKDTLKKLGYKITLTCNEGVTSARFGDPDSVIYMRRINREGSYSARDLINVVKKYDCN